MVENVGSLLTESNKPSDSFVQNIRNDLSQMRNESPLIWESKHDMATSLCFFLSLEPSLQRQHFEIALVKNVLIVVLLVET